MPFALCLVGLTIILKSDFVVLRASRSIRIRYGRGAEKSKILLRDYAVS
jgi:hypothetical protein